MGRVLSFWDLRVGRLEARGSGLGLGSRPGT